MKKILFFLILLFLAALFVLLASSEAAANIRNKTFEDYFRDYFSRDVGVKIAPADNEKAEEIRIEYLQIFAGYLRRRFSPTDDFCDSVEKSAIVPYMQFLKKYPSSELVDEAKLRIAEFYDVAFEREKARVWLDDIIENHPNDNYLAISVHYTPDRSGYSSFELILTAEKTAAWALYYRGAWFKEHREKDFQTILEKYGNCRRVVNLVEKYLEKIKGGKK